MSAALDAKGPDGFATWKDAAVAERLHRVALERTTPPQPEGAQGAVACVRLRRPGDLERPNRMSPWVDGPIDAEEAAAWSGRGEGYWVQYAYTTPPQPTEAAFVCTGDEIRCFDGNGCECELAGRKPPTDAARDREDAERLDFIESKRFDVCPLEGGGFDVYRYREGSNETVLVASGATAREAIDAARGAGGGES